MALAGIQAEQQMLDGINNTLQTPAALLGYTALHVSTGTGTTGTNENANSGSYARQATTWNNATAAQPSHKTNSGALSFSTLGSVQVTYVGQWSSGTYAGGTFGVGAALTAGVTAASISVASGAIDYSAS